MTISSTLSIDTKQPIAAKEASKELLRLNKGLLFNFLELLNTLLSGPQDANNNLANQKVFDKEVRFLQSLTCQSNVKGLGHRRDSYQHSPPHQLLPPTPGDYHIISPLYDRKNLTDAMFVLENIIKARQVLIEMLRDQINRRNHTVYETEKQVSSLQNTTILVS